MFHNNILPLYFNGKRNENQIKCVTTVWNAWFDQIVFKVINQT